MANIKSVELLNINDWVDVENEYNITLSDETYYTMQGNHDFKACIKISLPAENEGFLIEQNEKVNFIKYSGQKLYLKETIESTFVNFAD